MHLYNKHFKIQKFDNVNDIIKDYYDVRINYYTKRKSYIIDKL